MAVEFAANLGKRGNTVRTAFIRESGMRTSAQLAEQLTLNHIRAEVKLRSLPNTLRIQVFPERTGIAGREPDVRA
jgi:hypothetical protein